MTPSPHDIAARFIEAGDILADGDVTVTQATRSMDAVLMFVRTDDGRTRVYPSRQRVTVRRLNGLR